MKTIGNTTISIFGDTITLNGEAYYKNNTFTEEEVKKFLVNMNVKNFVSLAQDVSLQMIKEYNYMDKDELIEHSKQSDEMTSLLMILNTRNIVKQ